MVETTKALVIGVDEQGATVAFNGVNKPVSWETLRAAARQEDPELRRVYSELLKEAEDRAARGPVIVTVAQDHTNVYWSVRVIAVNGHGWGWYPRAADEGGSVSYSEAVFEAKDIAKRLGSRARLDLNWTPPQR